MKKTAIFIALFFVWILLWRRKKVNAWSVNMRFTAWIWSTQRSVKTKTNKQTCNGLGFACICGRITFRQQQIHSMSNSKSTSIDTHCSVHYLLCIKTTTKNTWKICDREIERKRECCRQNDEHFNNNNNNNSILRVDIFS